MSIDWGEAWGIVGGGLLATFSIMLLLALSTHFMGKLFMIWNQRKKKAAGEGEGETADV